jgi:hypothetical protein
MSEHEHRFTLPEDGFISIDTYPPQYPYTCECGAFTHDPETGAPCQTCAPLDYALRGPTITLKDGPFDGKQITRPVNRSVYLRVDPPEERVQKIVKYVQTDDPDVWVFESNSWTVPFEQRVTERVTDNVQ